MSIGGLSNLLRYFSDKISDVILSLTKNMVSSANIASGIFTLMSSYFTSFVAFLQYDCT